MKMLEHLPTEPGFTVKVIGTPDLDNHEHKALLVWFFSDMITLPIKDDWARGQFFELPYEQGPGWITLRFLEPEPGQRLKKLIQEAGVSYPMEPAKDEHHVPAVITFGYADSMTNIFTADIVHKPATGEFFMGEM